MIDERETFEDPPDPDKPWGPCEACDAGPWGGKGAYVNHWRAKHPDLDPPADATANPKADPKPGRHRALGSKPSVAPLVAEPLRFIGEIWATSDPVCGPILIASAERIGEAVNTIAQGDPKLYKRLTEGGTNMGYMQLALATFPLLAAIRQHHVEPRLKAIRERRELEAEAWSEPEPQEAQVGSAGE